MKAQVASASRIRSRAVELEVPAVEQAPEPRAGDHQDEHRGDGDRPHSAAHARGGRGEVVPARGLDGDP